MPRDTPLRGDSTFSAEPIARIELRTTEEKKCGGKRSPRSALCDRGKKEEGFFQRETKVWLARAGVGAAQGRFEKEDERRKVAETDNYATGLRNATLDFCANTRRA